VKTYLRTLGFALLLLGSAAALADADTYTDANGNTVTCKNEEVTTTQSTGHPIVGALAGGAVGGVVGNQFGKGSGKTAMTVAGAAGGAYAGHQLASGSKTTTTDQEHCKHNN
jgi:uncharacterized protein YcfJ